MGRQGGWVIAMVVGLLASHAAAPLPRVHAESTPEEQTLQGELLDPATYLKEELQGPEAVDQTYEAVDGGQTLALLADDGLLYLLLAAQPGEDPNELGYDYVNQRVRVTGAVYERAGLRGIVLSAIDPLTSAESAEESSETLLPSDVP